MNNEEIQEIIPYKLPFRTSDKVFQKYDKEGNPIGELHSYDDFLKELESFSGVNIELWDCPYGCDASCDHKNPSQEWISIEDRMPELLQNVLVTAKVGYDWDKQRPLKMFVGYFHDANEFFKKLKPCIEFVVDCGCSGAEFDKENLEVLFWQPLPKPPEKKIE